MRRGSGFIIGLAAAILLLAATGAQATFRVGYDYYCFATSVGAPPPLKDDDSLGGQSFVMKQATMYGNAAAGNYAHAFCIANIAAAGVVARATAAGGVCDEWPYGFTATGRVNRINFEDGITFTVPAGTYPGGVQVEITGRAVGVLSASYAASATVQCYVNWGGAQYNPGLLSIPNQDDTSIWVDDPFSLVWQIVAPGATLGSPADIKVYLQAGISNALTATVLEGTSPNYVTGSAGVDFTSGLVVEELNAPVGVTWVSDSGVFLSRPSSVHDLIGAAKACTLLPNYPNPFNPSTTIAFETAVAGPVRLQVFDLRGRLTATLVDGVLDAGLHRQVWQGRDQAGRRAASGTYFYRLEAGGESLTRRMTLIE